MESSNPDKAMGGDKPKEPVYLVVMAKRPFEYVWLPTYVQDPLKNYNTGEVLVMYRNVSYEEKKTTTTSDAEMAEPESAQGDLSPEESSESPVFLSEGFNPEAVPIVDFVPEDSSKLSEGLEVVLKAIGISNDSEAMAQVNAPHGSCFVIHQESVSSGNKESKDGESLPVEEVHVPLRSIVEETLISDKARGILNAWSLAHSFYPFFPTKEQIISLSRQTMLSKDQLYSYFCRQLRRYLAARGQP